MSDGQRRGSSIWRTSFLGFFTAQSVSFVGSEITYVAFPLIAVVNLHASPVQMGLIAAAQRVPNLLAGLVIGPYVDRVSKRRVLVTADVVRAVLLTAVPLAALTGGLGIGVLAAVGFLLGLLTVAADIAYVTYVPRLVPQEQLVLANGRLETSYSAAQVGGPGIGALLVSTIGAANALLGDAASFLFSAVVTRLLPVTGVPEPKDDGQVGQPFWASATQVWRHRALRLLAFDGTGYNFFSGFAVTVTLLFMVRDLGESGFVYGVVLSVGAIGGVVGGAATTRLVSSWGMPASIAVSLMVAAAGEAVVTAAQGPRWLAAALVAVGQFGIVFGTTVHGVASLSVRQIVVNHDVLGAVYGVMRTVTRGAMPLGALLAGWLAVVIGTRATLGVAAVGQLAVAMVCFRYRYFFESVTPPAHRDPTDLLAGEAP
ncbi:MAG TPA: MFS transporter [Pseudonocardiaceae bacterium]|nr:MFS transporter [Pseudonocardiaceae bacterium]